MDDLITFLRARLDEEATWPATSAAWNGQCDAPGVHVDDDRWLAEVEAKRRILAEHAIVDPGEEWQHCRVCHDYESHDAAEAPCSTLKLLALPYVGHPDFPRGVEAVRHQWQLDERGEPDTGAFEIEAETTGHNGPRCTVCGFDFCIHCTDEGWEQECPGPPPEGFWYLWFDAGNGKPPFEPSLMPRSKE